MDNLKLKTWIFALLVLTILSTTAQKTNDSYNWSLVRIGGGGYITGMKIHPLDNNIQYFRTDVGGAYRWDDSKKEMVQILNFPFEKKDHYGVAGIALHPTNQSIIYLAVDRANTNKTSKILYSINKGDNWTEIAVPPGVKFGANGGRVGGTGINDTDREGSPIEINPNNPNELWVGTREKGLWVMDLSKEINQRWRKITSIPDNDQEGSIRSIKFNPNNNNQIIVGYATKGIYRSTNGGQSFELINNGYSDLKLIADISFSKNGDQLYVAARNKGVYKLSNPQTNRTWKKLNLPFSNIFRGYQTVTASPHSNNVVMASVAASSGNNLARLQISFDGGNTWTTKSQTNITNIFTWKDVSRSAGTHTSQIVFDPKDSNKLYYTSWFGLWHTDNWKQSTVHWKNNRARGHEEMVPSGLYAFPKNTKNNTLGINSADYVAIISKNPNSYNNKDVKPLMDDNSKAIKGVDITACEKYPNNFILSSTDKWQSTGGAPNYGALLYTSNGGDSYNRITAFNRNWGRSLVAIASNDPSNFIVVHGNQIHFTKDKGKSFQKANIPNLGNVVENNVFTSHRPLTQDYVSKNTFYLYDRTNGSIYSSTDGGSNWSKKSQTLPAHNINYSKASLKAVPNVAGHLWFNHPINGLYWSENFGTNWTKINNVKKAKSIAIGKERNEGDYPTLYMIGTLNSNPEEAVYRSTDRGKSWVKINNFDSLFLLSNPRYMAADRTIFGKVYIGIEGLGVWQGNDNSSPPLPSSALISDGLYYIESSNNNQRLLARNNEQHSARMHNPGDWNDQKWFFKHLGNNIYTIKNHLTGKYLQVNNNSCDGWVNVVTGNTFQEAHQKWKIIKNKEYYSLIPSNCQSVALDRNKGLIDANVQVWTFDYIDNPNQKWNIFSVGRSKETRIKNTYSIYPNPATHILNIELYIKYDNIKVMNSLGEIVPNIPKQKSTESILTMDVSNLNPGLYFIKISYQKISKIIRFIKK